ncbi:MAG: J domain-containing protein [Myxococcales bacterium]|nr:J domain-containing protein [Myxococcales bacterium]
MAKERDLYEILEVPKSASQDDLKSAFRKLARKYHPDVNPGNKQAEERFKELNAAFEVLSDPKKRALYDELGADAIRIGFDPRQAEAYRQWKRGGSGGAAGSRSRSGMGGGGADFGGFNFDFGQSSGSDFSSIFETLFGGGFGGGGAHRSAASRQRGAAMGPVEGDDLSLDLTIPLNLAVRGGEQEIRFEHGSRCGQCAGGGMASGTRRVCPACQGTGQGSGKPKILTVKIPAGAEEGSKIRLAGQGAEGLRGGPAGDLYLITHIAPHPRIRRDGRDLYLDLPITVAEAFFGGEVRCPTFDGNFTLKIPEHSQSGRKLRLRGLGVPQLRGGGPRGDFYAVLQIVLPESDSKANQEAIRTLDAAYDLDVRAGISL